MGHSRDRDEGWFTTLYTAHYPQIVKYGLRRLIDPEASTELAQEVFVIAWRRRADVPERGLPWLYGVARRLLANQWRARRANPAVVPLSHPDALAQSRRSDEPDSMAGLADIRSALATLPEIDQEILRLIGWEQLTLAEAATVLDCGRGAAAVRLHRARRRLAAAITTHRSVGISPVAAGL